MSLGVVISNTSNRLSGVWEIMPKASVFCLSAYTDLPSLVAVISV